MKLNLFEFVRRGLRRWRTKIGRLTRRGWDAPFDAQLHAHADPDQAYGALPQSGLPAEDRRVDLTTATKIELARIYCDVFGTAAAARNMATAGLNPSTLNRVLKRQYRRRTACRQFEPVRTSARRWQTEERRGIKRW